MTPSKWLPQVLTANGMNEQDLEKALQLEPGSIRELMDKDEATGTVWDAVLTWFNDLLSLSYPAANILDDIRDYIQAAGPDAGCEVYYGVNAGNLIFTGLRVTDTGAYYGSDTDSPLLAAMHLTLKEAQTLFFKQNCTLQAD